MTKSGTGWVVACANVHQFHRRSHGSEKAVQQKPDFFASGLPQSRRGRYRRRNLGGSYAIEQGSRRCRNLRCRVRYRGLRWRRGRAAGGVVLALARQQGRGAGKGGDTGRHVVQGGLLGLGTQQCRHAQGRHSGRQAALPALRRAIEPAAVLRSQSSPLWPFRVGIQYVRGHLRQLVGGHRAAVGERRAAVSARSPGAGLLRGNGDHRRDRPGSLSQGRRALHVRWRAGGNPHFVHGVPARWRDHTDRAPRAEGDPQRQGRGHRS